MHTVTVSHTALQLFVLVKDQAIARPSYSWTKEKTEKGTEWVQARKTCPVGSEYQKYIQSQWRPHSEMRIYFIRGIFVRSFLDIYVYFST